MDAPAPIEPIEATTTIDSGLGLHDTRSVAVLSDSYKIVGGGGGLVHGDMWGRLKIWQEDGTLLHEIQTDEIVQCIAAFSDGSNRMVSGGRTIRIWDDNGHQLTTFPFHGQKYIQCIAIFPDNIRIVSGDLYGALMIWDADTRTHIHTLQINTPDGANGVKCVAVFPDGDRIVAGGYSKTLKIWDIETRQQLLEFRRHNKTVNAVAIFPDGDRIVSGSADNNLIIWNADTGESLHVLHGHTWVTCIAVFPNGDGIVCGDSTGILRIWNAETGEPLYILQEHTKDVVAVAIFPDGSGIVSGSHDGTLKIWDTPEFDISDIEEGKGMINIGGRRLKKKRRKRKIKRRYKRKSKRKSKRKTKRKSKRKSKRKTRRKSKKVRKHKGIVQSGGRRGKLKKGYKYTGKKTKTGLSIIVKS